MESNERYYARRAVEELRAAARAVTPEARARRHALALSFARKAGMERELVEGGLAGMIAARDRGLDAGSRMASPAGLEAAIY